MLAYWAAAQISGDGIPVELFAPLGASGLAAMAVWMIYTGRLITRRELDDAIRDRNYWRDLAQHLTAQNTKLMIGAEVATDVLKTLPDIHPNP